MHSVIYPHQRKQIKTIFFKITDFDYRSGAGMLPLCGQTSVCMIEGGVLCGETYLKTVFTVKPSKIFLPFLQTSFYVLRNPRVVRR